MASVFQEKAMHVKVWVHPAVYIAMRDATTSVYG